jgi:hypothetical protein
LGTVRGGAGHERGTAGRPSRRDRSGQAVAIVGAGVSIAAIDNAPTASWAGLLQNGVAYCEGLLGPSLPAGWAGIRREFPQLHPSRWNPHGFNAALRVVAYGGPPRRCGRRAFYAQG